MWNIPSVLSVRPVAPFMGCNSHPDSPAEPLLRVSVKSWTFLWFLLLLSCFFVCLSFILFINTPTHTSDWLAPYLCPSPPPRVQQSRPAFRISATRAVLRGLPHRPAVSRKWCHNDRERQLRPNRWQNLRCRPFPDGEHQLLSPRCLQDHVTEVKRS